MPAPDISLKEIQGPDVHFTGGLLILPGYGNPVNGEMTISDGSISEIMIEGSLPASSSRGYERVDLRGRIISPAFYDAHMHFRDWCIGRSGIDLSGFKDWKEVIHQLESVAYGTIHNEFFTESNFLLGVNLDDTGFSGSGEPDRNQLDSIFGDIPVLIKRICGHKAYANTAFLDTCDGKEQVPENGRLTDGRGIELAWNIDTEVSVLANCLRRGREILYGMGVIGGVEIMSSEHLDKFLRAFDELSCGLRLNIALVLKKHLKPSSFSGVDPNHKSEDDTYLSDIRGQPIPVFSKLFADGSIGAGTASFTKEYSDGSRSDPIMSRNELKISFDESVRLGLVPMVHAIGDRAVRDVVETAVANDVRIRIEHAECIDDRTLNMMKTMKGAVCLQPNFVSKWGGSKGLYEKRLGSCYSDLNRFASIDRIGLSWCFGTDMMPPGPLNAVKGALKHPKLDERIDFCRAINGFTNYSVRDSLLGDEGQGTLAEENPADIVIINGFNVERLFISGVAPYI